MPTNQPPAIIKYHLLDSASYVSERDKFIEDREGDLKEPYNAGDGAVTIGIGFNISGNSDLRNLF